VKYAILKRRRDERQTYVLQSEFNLDIAHEDPDDAAAGGVWEDPPNYFEQIVYPGYVKAHEKIFEGDVENGPVRKEWAGLKVLVPKEGTEGMTMAFNQSCIAIDQYIRRGPQRLIST
jgi:nicotinamide/nicotinate riboside kinase